MDDFIYVEVNGIGRVKVETCKCGKVGVYFRHDSETGDIIECRCGHCGNKNLKFEYAGKNRKRKKGE